MGFGVLAIEPPNNYLMKLPTLLVVLASAFIITSCSKDDKELVVITENIKSGNIDFSDLKVGQQSMYLNYWYNCDETAENVLTGDTLIVTVTSDENGLFLEERNSEGSSYQFDPIVYSIEPQEGMVKITERTRSRIFNFYGNDFLKFNPENTSEITQNECNFSIDEDVFIGNEMGFVSRVDLRGLKAQDKYIVSCVPTFEVNGYLIYDKKQVIMAHRYYAESWWTEPDVILSESTEGYLLIND